MGTAEKPQSDLMPKPGPHEISRLGADSGSERPQDAESSDFYGYVPKRWAMRSRFPLLNNATGWLASSFLFARGKRLFEANRRCWNLSMTKWDKLLAGGYIILKDFAAGRFPPEFDDQAKAYQAEIDFYLSTPGQSLKTNVELHCRKPFWGPQGFAEYSAKFVKLLRIFEQIGLRPSQRLLEMGCGAGWMAEFLALSGYSVCGTTIMPMDIVIAKKRVAAWWARDLCNQLDFKVSAMESVDEALQERESFDGVFVFEALHHAFDWRQAIKAAYRCLKASGWLILANEPNLLHTFISYRVARLSNTHEIGLSRKALIREMQQVGFSETRVFEPKLNNLISAHWIAARK
jgi:2-polyprenyl-3-methyl-5-hydroxy-6-metoxy-1,4-benzoquinol methylase